MSGNSSETMSLGLGSVRSAVKRKFAAAKTSGDLIFSETKVTIIKTKHDIPIQLRYCPALDKKPTATEPHPTPPLESTTTTTNLTSPKPKPTNPFASPSPSLLITPIPHPSPTHNLLLNKYPIIPHHFILATIPYLPQTHLLRPLDLHLTHRILLAWRDSAPSPPTPPSDMRGEEDNDLLAFFNSGPHSGASQPHRHIQFLPVGDMKVGLGKEEARRWQPLLKRFQTMHPLAGGRGWSLHWDKNLPFLGLSTPLRQGMGEEELEGRYLYLLRAATWLLRRAEEKKGVDGKDGGFGEVDLEGVQITKPGGGDDGELAISYNLAMTAKHMAICPRVREGTVVPGLEGDGGREVALNGTVLGGTMMVRREEEWDALRRVSGTEAVDEMLDRIGVATAVKEDAVGGRL